ncbi:hypothetical protein L7F22_029574 [Adiantum nelumboides]|nr:hypothetical protein [Adiantum nelumboides]
MVRALRDSMGQLHTCPDEILEMASVYYETLFTSDLLTGDVLDARDDVWSFIRPVVSGDMQTTIMQPFSLQEVTDVVHGLDGASCPGDDGLTRQFFLQYWDLVSQPLQEGLQEIFDSGIMPQSMSSGIISLIPKGGDASTLRQWRPITLMSSIYKILARMITSRLRPFLPDLIHSSHTGDGQVYTTGSRQRFGALNAFGAVTIEDHVNQFGPLKGVSVRWIAAGSEHSAAVLNDGSIVTWGWGEHGQLGLGTTTDQSSPNVVFSVPRMVNSRVYCGCGFSFLCQPCT